MPPKKPRTTPKKFDSLNEPLDIEEKQELKTVVMDQFLLEKPPITKEFDASYFIGHVIKALQTKNPRYQELTEDKYHRSTPLYFTVYSYVKNKLRYLDPLNK